MQMYGADSAELRRLATEMNRTADDLDSDQLGLSKLLYRVSWLGDIATSFLESWTGLCVPKMNMSTGFLRESADELMRHADEQDVASASDGGGPGPITTAPPNGDRGGTFEWERRVDWKLGGTTDEQRGREVLLQLLNDTGNERLIAQDEFEIIKTADGKYIINLPGVIDLSKPHLWWDEHNRSVRDVEMSAIGSAGNTSVSANLYAQYVRRAMEVYGIPKGSEIMLAGHSYGADTAVDLAADPAFNGPNGYRVTHVMAAAYNSEKQMASVPSSTNLLVIQNKNDVAVRVERALEGPTRVLSGDFLGGALQTGREIIAPAVSGSISGAIKAGSLGQVVGAVKGGTSGIWHASMIEPGTFVDAAGHTRVVFDGGGEGFGHHQNNYTSFVGSTDNPAIAEFARSLAQAGYDKPGIRTAHDVSVPG